MSFAVGAPCRSRRAPLRWQFNLRPTLNPLRAAAPLGRPVVFTTALNKWQAQVDHAFLDVVLEIPQAVTPLVASTLPASNVQPYRLVNCQACHSLSPPVYVRHLRRRSAAAKHSSPGDRVVEPMPPPASGASATATATTITSASHAPLAAIAITNPGAAGTGTTRAGHTLLATTRTANAGTPTSATATCAFVGTELLRQRELSPPCGHG